MDKLWWWAAALVLVGCSAVPVHGEFPLHDAPSQPTYAVALPGTAFATLPLPHARLVAPVSSDYGPTFGRLLGYRGAMAALEVGEPAWQRDGHPNHCVNALAVPSGLRLVLWVPRDQLAPVLREPLRHRYADGSGYDLAPGLPLGPAVAQGERAGHHYRPLQTARFLSAAEVPDSAVGLTYQPAPLPKAETASDEQWLEAGPLPLGPGQLLRRPGESEPMWSQQVRVDPTDPSQRLVGLQDRCARFVVRLPAAALGKPVGGFLLGSLGAGASQLRAGAVLTWADGAVAGRALRDTWVGRPLPPRGQRTCFAVPVFTHGYRKGAKALRPVEPGELEVCVESSELFRATRPSQAGAGQLSDH